MRKQILYAACMLLIAGLITACGTPASSAPENHNTAPVQTEKSSLAEQTTVTAYDETSEAEETNTSASRSSLDILKLDGHPTFFGETADAKKIWEQYQGEDSIMIKGGITHHYKYEQAFMVLDCFEGGGAYRYTDSEFINGIQIRPENFKEDTTLSLEEAISLVEEYMPLDIIEEWYSCFETCYQDESVGSKYYFSVYKITDDGKNKIKQEELPYSFWVSFGIRVDSSGHVQSIGIYNSRIADGRNEPEKHDWDYQLPMK